MPEAISATHSASSASSGSSPTPLTTAGLPCALRPFRHSQTRQIRIPETVHIAAANDVHVKRTIVQQTNACGIPGIQPLGIQRGENAIRNLRNRNLLDGGSNGSSRFHGIGDGMLFIINMSAIDHAHLRNGVHHGELRVEPRADCPQPARRTGSRAPQALRGRPVRDT